MKSLKYLLYLATYMKVSDKSRKKVEQMATHFTKNRPPLCREHMPKGLPIDAPEGVSKISDNHPSYKFEKIVEEESKGYTGEKQVIKARVRSYLRELFAKIYYSNGDKLSCLECYENRKEQDGGVPIRMEISDNWRRNNRTT
jgi:hypothetical protein